MMKLTIFFMAIVVIIGVTHAANANAIERLQEITKGSEGEPCLEQGSKSCQPLAPTKYDASKHYNEECETSSECDIRVGLCCSLQRRHRQPTRNACSYFKDPSNCIGPVALDQVEVDVELTHGEDHIG